MAQYSDRFLLLDNNDLSINEKIETLSKIMADTSFEVFGKTIKSPPSSFENNYRKKSPWFNDDCKNAKKVFFKSKKYLSEKRAM